MPKPQYTIVDALADARHLRKQPEYLIDGPNSRKLIETLLSALERSPCYLNAVIKGRETFVLVSTDRSAPFAIRNWAEHAAAHGCQKVVEAFRIAQRWEQQDQKLTKWPD